LNSAKRLSLVESIFYWLLRLILGTLVLGAGIGKLLDVPGFLAIIGTYKLGLTTSIVWPAAIVVVVFEIALGLWILSGYRLQMAALWPIAMHGGYFVLLTSTLLRGLHLNNCGCFGVFLARPLEWYSPLEDLVLMVLSYILFVLARKRSKLDQSAGG
jgi:uncharacterized membrane protein YphA (DoxX/SURF4 family)